MRPFRAALLTSALPPELQRRLRALERYAFDAPPAAAPFPLPQTNLSARHLNQLLGLGQLCRLAQPPKVGNAGTPATAFLVAETAKERLRVIVWAAGANAGQERILSEGKRLGAPQDGLGPEDFRLDLPTASQVLSSVAAEEAVGLLDLQAAFLQRSLPAHARAAYAFRAAGSWWAPTRLCMGATLSCAIMQLYTAALALAAIGDGEGRIPWEAVEVYGVGPSWRRKDPTSRCRVVVKIYVYVDNIRFSGDAEAVRMCVVAAKRLAVVARAALQARDEYCSVPLQPFPAGAAFAIAPYTFLGIRVKHRHAAPHRKIRQSVVAAALQLLTHGALSLGDAVSLLGRVTWAAGVGGGDIRRHLNALLLLRRWANLATRGAPREHVCYATKADALAVARLAVDVLSWRRCGQAALELEGPAAQRQPVLAYSDASHTGWGVVLLSPDGRSLSFGQRWPEGETGEPPQHINVLEAAALALAAGEVRRAEAERDWLCREVDFLTDSTVVLGAVKKGRSRNERITRAVALFRRSVEGRDWQIRHVVSAQNLADAPSRGTGDGLGGLASPDE